MHDVELQVEVAGQNNFRVLGIVRGKEVAIGLRTGVINAVRTVVDEGFCCRCRFIEVLFVTGYAVILAISALVKEDARLQSQSGPLGDAVGTLGRWQVVDGVIEIFFYLGHQLVAGCSRCVKSAIGRR